MATGATFGYCACVRPDEQTTCGLQAKLACPTRLSVGVSWSLSLFISLSAYAQPSPILSMLWFRVFVVQLGQMLVINGTYHHAISDMRFTANLLSRGTVPECANA